MRALSKIKLMSIIFIAALIIGGGGVTFHTANAKKADVSPTKPKTPEVTSKENNSPLINKDDQTMQGPLQFRCDNMQIFTKPNSTLCVGNVVFRRGPLLGCCNIFEGLADENWNLKQATCKQNVRAKHNDELIWSEHSVYDPVSGDLTFTGSPIVRRGQSVISGKRIIANVNEERARVEKPQGVLINEPQDNTSPTTQTIFLEKTPLPAKCPLPGPKRK